MRWNDFFGPGNGIEWTKMPPRTVDALAPFRRLVESNAPVAVLPRIIGGGTRLRWYIGWRDARDARFAVDIIRAYLGRTYAVMTTVPRGLVAGDPVEDAFGEEYGGRAFGIDVSYEHREEIRGRLQLMANCLLARPSRVGHRFRPVGRVLRDAEFALLQGDDNNVSACIAELRSGGHLDATNLLYLEIRRLAARCDWATILGHPDLSRLLATAPPRSVREAVIQAVYHEILFAPIAPTNTDDLVARFSREVMPRFGSVFGSRRGLVGAEVQICFTLRDLVLGRHDDPGIAEGLTRLAKMGMPGASHEPTLPSVVLPGATPTARTDTSTDPLYQAKECFADFDLDGAFRAAMVAPTGRERAQLLVHCAAVLDSDDTAIEAMIAWEALGDEDKARLGSRAPFQAQLARLNDRIGKPPGVQEALVVPFTPLPVTSWATWFARLRDPRPWPAAVSVASIGQRDWSVATVATNEGALSGIVETLEATLPEWSHDALRCSLPFLQAAFVTTPPDARLATVVAALFDVLVTDQALSVPACEALIDLGCARLALTHKHDDYRLIVDTIADAIMTVHTPKAVALVLDALEGLLVAPCPDLDSRASVSLRLVSLAEQWWTRINIGEAVLLRQLLLELRIPHELPSPIFVGESEPHGDGSWSALSGATVALYSLDEGSLARAAAALVTACSSVKVRTFCEYVGTDALRDAARSSDVFVIATRSAKHAATIFIEANRRDRGDLRYASGKGSTSLITAVRNWALERR
jgi:hypothetical protein